MAQDDAAPRQTVTDSRDRKPPGVPPEVFQQRVRALLDTKASLADHDDVTAFRTTLDDDARPTGYVDVRSTTAIRAVESTLADHDLGVTHVQQDGTVYGGHNDSAGELLAVLDAGAVRLAFAHED